LRQHGFWAIAIIFVWLSQLLLGSISAWQVEFGFFSTCLSAGLLVVALWRLRHGLPSQSAIWATLILVGAVCLSALQLVAVPPEVWMQFPGREFVISTLNATGQSPGWMPLSLAPLETLNYLIYSIPALALFFASLSLPPNFRQQILWVVVLTGVIATILGLAQRANANSEFLTFFGGKTGLGFFANKNFHGALLFSTIPLLAALSLNALATKALHSVIVALFATAALATALIGIGTTTSRAAIALAMLAVFLTPIMLWRREVQTDRKLHVGYKFVGFAIVLFAAAQFGLAGISRLAETDHLADGRALMAANTLLAVQQYFPFGSGFGSFVPIYAMNEQPDQMLGAYVNHAHNDWLELALEGGLPMIVLLVAFIVWFIFACFKAWRERADNIGNFSVRASAITILLLCIHSISDYPLRTRALMGLFAMCCGFLAYGTRPKPKKAMRKPVPIPAPDVKVEAAPSSNSQPSRKTYFVRKDTNLDQ
jgi:O-antigen ligase